MRIVSELILFGTAVLWGIMIDAFYDVFRIFRQYVKHGALWTGIEDFVYCFISGAILFKLIFDSNDGIIRWYILFAAAFGIWIHYKTLGRLLTAISKKISDRVKVLTGKILKKCINIFRRMFSKILKKKLR